MEDLRKGGHGVEVVDMCLVNGYIVVRPGEVRNPLIVSYDSNQAWTMLPTATKITSEDKMYQRVWIRVTAKDAADGQAFQLNVDPNAHCYLPSSVRTPRVWTADDDADSGSGCSYVAVEPLLVYDRQAVRRYVEDI